MLKKSRGPLKAPREPDENPEPISNKHNYFWEIIRHRLQELGVDDLGPYEQARQDYKRSRAARQAKEERRVKQAALNIKELKDRERQVNKLVVRFEEMGLIVDEYEGIHWEVLLAFRPNRSQRLLSPAPAVVKLDEARSGIWPIFNFWPSGIAFFEKVDAPPLDRIAVNLVRVEGIIDKLRETYLRERSSLPGQAEIVSWHGLDSRLQGLQPGICIHWEALK